METNAYSENDIYDEEYYIEDDMNVIIMKMNIFPSN